MADVGKTVAGHTATPWETDNYSVRSSGASGRQICLCEISIRGRPYNETYDEAIANAAFIVKAANSHDDLVKALTEIDTLAVCTGVVDPAQHRNMLENIARIARKSLTGAA